MLVSAADPDGESYTATHVTFRENPTSAVYLELGLAYPPNAEVSTEIAGDIANAIASAADLPVERVSVSTEVEPQSDKSGGVVVLATATIQPDPGSTTEVLDELTSDSAVRSIGEQSGASNSTLLSGTADYATDELLEALRVHAAEIEKLAGAAIAKLVTESLPPPPPISPPPPYLPCTESDSMRLLERAVSGTKRLVVAAFTCGVSIGDVLLLGVGTPSAETAIVAGFGSLILRGPLQFTHEANATIVRVAQSPSPTPPRPPPFPPAPAPPPFPPPSLSSPLMPPPPLKPGEGVDDERLGQDAIPDDDDGPSWDVVYGLIALICVLAVALAIVIFFFTVIAKRRPPPLQAGDAVQPEQTITPGPRRRFTSFINNMPRFAVRQSMVQVRAPTDPVATEESTIGLVQHLGATGAIPEEGDGGEGGPGYTQNYSPLAESSAVSRVRGDSSGRDSPRSPRVEPMAEQSARGLAEESSVGGFQSHLEAKYFTTKMRKMSQAVNPRRLTELDFFRLKSLGKHGEPSPPSTSASASACRTERV